VKSEVRSPRCEVIIALGSNLGDLQVVLLQAIGLLKKLTVSQFRQSSLWQSTPVDCPPGSSAFVNAAVAFEPAEDETPETLLARLQEIEKEFGRRPRKVLNEPRPLDLDLIAFGSVIHSTPQLTLPHPRAHLRRFVLEPLNEIVPDLILPDQTQPIHKLLADLRNDEVVVKL